MGASQSKKNPRTREISLDTTANNAGAAGGGPQGRSDQTAPVAATTAAAEGSAPANEVITPSTLNSSSNLNYSQMNLEKLVEMGFKEEDARKSLIENNDMVNIAAQDLVDKGTSRNSKAKSFVDVLDFLDMDNFGIRFRCSLFDRFVHAIQAVVLLDAVSVNQERKGDKYYTLLLLILALMNGHSAITNAGSRDHLRYLTVITLIVGTLVLSVIVIDQFFGISAGTLTFPCRYSSQSYALPVLMWQINILTLVSRRYSLRVLRQLVLSGGSAKKNGKDGWNLALGPMLIRFSVYIIANTALLGAISYRGKPSNILGWISSVILICIYLLHICFLLLPPQVAPAVVYTSVFVASRALLGQMDIIPALDGWAVGFVPTMIYLLMTLLTLRYLHELLPATFENPTKDKKTD